MKIGELLWRLFHRSNTRRTTAREVNRAASAPARDTPKGPTTADIRSGLLPLVREGRLVIPDGMSEIPNRLFDGHFRGEERAIVQLVSITIPGTVKSIGECAFSGCENLEEIFLHEGVERIGSNAFTGCRKLSGIRLPASVTEIDGRAFYHSGITEPVFSADGKTLITTHPIGRIHNIRSRRACNRSYGRRFGMQRI